MHVTLGLIFAQEFKKRKAAHRTGEVKKMLKDRNCYFSGNGHRSTGKPIWTEKKQNSENENVVSTDIQCC